jgi:glutamate racemase
MIDTMVLGCTHYPLLQHKIQRYLPTGISVVSQGAIVARSLADYLKRHPEIETRCSKNRGRDFFTTEKAEIFDQAATVFYGRTIRCRENREIIGVPGSPQ